MSRLGRDRVEKWLARANEQYADGLTLPFVRTLGDEMQALTSSPEALVGIIREAVQDKGWWLGVGIGEVEEPLGYSSRESRGEAFWLARTALEKAKSQRAVRPFVLRSHSPETVDALAACLHALSFLVLRRTARQTEVANARRDGMSVGEIAERRSVTVQGVYELLQAAGVEEEAELGRLAVQLAGAALE
jgi:DNA-binding NarL/FixJ family response regulator